MSHLSQLNKLQQVFTFHLEGVFWKLRFDLQKQQIAIETRFPEKLQTVFHVIDIPKGKFVLENYKSEAPWRVGLAGISGGYLALHGYNVKPEEGLHKGFSVIDISNGSLVFDFPDLTYKGLVSEIEAIAYNLLGNLVLVDLVTGEKKTGFLNPEIILADMQVFENQRLDGLQLPVPYLPSDTHYKLLQDFVRQKTGLEAVQVIEYAENENVIILSFYVERQGSLANYLVACSASGEVLLLDCLQQQSTGVGMDTFFIFAGKLYFMKEKSVISAYLL